MSMSRVQTQAQRHLRCAIDIVAVPVKWSQAPASGFEVLDCLLGKPAAPASPLAAVASAPV